MARGKQEFRDGISLIWDSAGFFQTLGEKTDKFNQGFHKIMDVTPTIFEDLK